MKMWYLLLAFAATWLVCLALPDGYQLSNSGDSQLSVQCSLDAPCETFIASKDNAFNNHHRSNSDGPPPYIDCNFDAPCDGFITSTGNDFNQPTDVAWQRVDHLQTTDSKPDGNCLEVFYDTATEPGRNITARVLTPALDNNATICYVAQIYLFNATLNVRYADTERMLWSVGAEITPGNIDGIWVQVASTMTERTEALLLEEVLDVGGRSEAAVGGFRVYRVTHNCSEVDWVDPDWPLSTTWPSPTTSLEQTTSLEHQLEMTTPGAAAAALPAALLTLSSLVAGLLMR